MFYEKNKDPCEVGLLVLFKFHHNKNATIHGFLKVGYFGVLSSVYGSFVFFSFENRRFQW